MNFFNPTLLACLDDLTQIRERVQARSQDGTTVPESVLQNESGAAAWSSSFWMPEQASSYAPHVDFVYMSIFWISTFFFVGIIATMIYFVFKYRRKGKEINPLPSPDHNTGLEIFWSAVPSLLMLWMFYEGAQGYFNMRAPGEVAEEIQVKAQKFTWEFTYPDGDKSGELHLVMDRPTMLVMHSTDVLHSFFVPAFRQKMDVVPGRFTYAYINANKVDTFRLTCAEYCGDEHSKMKTIARVHKNDADRKASTEWIKAEHAPWQYGERLYQINCSGCHRVDGTNSTGPPLDKTWGAGTRKFTSGAERKVDHNYIKDSLERPDTEIVEGFQNKMTSFKGKLNDDDINAIIQYLKKLSGDDSYSKDPIGDKPIGIGADEQIGADEGAGDAAQTEAAPEVSEPAQDEKSDESVPPAAEEPAGEPTESSSDSK